MPGGCPTRHFAVGQDEFNRHVLATSRNVNILVLDTEVYSNTGGQAGPCHAAKGRARNFSTSSRIFGALRLLSPCARRRGAKRAMRPDRREGHMSAPHYRRRKIERSLGGRRGQPMYERQRLLDRELYGEARESSMSNAALLPTSSAVRSTASEVRSKRDR